MIKNITYLLMAWLGLLQLSDVQAQVQVIDTLAQGLSRPVAFEVLAEDSFIVNERASGRIIKIGRSSLNVLYTIPNLNVTLGGNGYGADGLIGICLDPDYASNRFFYVCYTTLVANPYNGQGLIAPYSLQPQFAQLPQIVVTRLTDSGTTAVNPINIWQWTVPAHVQAANVNQERYAGNLRIGADDKLYVSIGDLAFMGYNQGGVNIVQNAQNIYNPSGKIIRLNTNGTIPQDNPYFIAGASAWSINNNLPMQQAAGNALFHRMSLYSMGFRNAYDFSLNTLTDQFIAEDNGDIGGDEINLVQAGANYGYINNPPGTVFQMLGAQIGLGPTGVLTYTKSCIKPWQNSLLSASVFSNLAGGYDIMQHNFLDPPLYTQFYANPVQMTFNGQAITTLMQSPAGHVYALKHMTYTAPNNSGAIYKIGMKMDKQNYISAVSGPCPYPLQVCGSYRLPRYSCTDSGTVQRIKWQIRQGGAIVKSGVVPAASIDTIAQNYCFELWTPDLPGNPASPDGFDILTEVVFNRVSGTDSVLSDTNGYTVGRDNDFFVNCPQLQCCDTCITDARNMVNNSNFDLGYQYFSSQLIKDSVAEVNSGRYAVVSATASGWNYTHWTKPADHSGTGGKYMVVNSPVGNVAAFWKNTYPVVQGKTYRLCFWVHNLVDTNYNYTDPVIRVKVNGKDMIERDTIREQDGWVLISTCWYASSSSASIELLNHNTSSDTSGNNFALDDISFGLCASCCDKITATVEVQEGGSADTCYYQLNLQLADSFACASIDKVEIRDGINQQLLFTYSQLGLSAGHGLVKYFTQPANGQPCIGRTFRLYYISADGRTICSPEVLAIGDTTTDPPDTCCTDCVSQQDNLVQNGNFSAGNQGFTSQLNYVASGMTWPGKYSIRDSTNLTNPAFSCVGRSGSATDKFLICDLYTGNGTATLWKQCIAVQPGRMYKLCFWVNNLIKAIYDFADPSIEVRINGVTIVPLQNIPELPNQWELISSCWLSDSTTACIEIMGKPNSAAWLRDIWQGNDLAIDDISFGLCPSAQGMQQLSSGKITGENDAFKIYPNPAHQTLMLELRQQADASASIHMYDLSGRLLKTQNITAGTRKMNLDISGLRPGIYLLRLHNAGAVFSHKLVIY